MSEAVYLSSLLPFRIKKIQTGAELFLCTCLNAYVNKHLGKHLELGAIRVSKDLLKQDIFRYAKDWGYQTDPVIFHADDEKVAMPFKPCEKEYSRTIYDNMSYVEGYDDQGNYVRQFDLMSNSQANIWIRRGTADVSLNYLYLVAHMLFMRYCGKPYKLVVAQNHYSLHRYEYANLILLRDYGNKILSDTSLFELVCDPAINVELGWLAYVTDKRHKGFMPMNGSSFTAAEKLNYFKENNYAVGDVILFVTRKVGKCLTDVSRDIDRPHIAVITQLMPRGITLTYFSSPLTTLTKKKRIEIKRANGAGRMYTPNEYKKFNPSVVTFDWLDIGVDGLSTTESCFLLPPVQDEISVQWLDNGVEERAFSLDYPNTIYAFFEDRHIQYNKKKFLKTYFKDSVPVYDQFMRGVKTQ